jgi:hypothetical protein
MLLRQSDKRMATRQALAEAAGHRFLDMAALNGVRLKARDRPVG